MDIQRDTGIPLIEFSHIESWAGLADYLTLIGIETTADALQARRKRYGLPIRGGGSKGRLVFFTTPELNAWLTHLRGCTLKQWLDRQRRRREQDLPLLSGQPGRRPAAKKLPLPPSDLFALTTWRNRAPEHLIRDETGYLYVARDSALFSEAAAKTVDDAHDWRAWRYHAMRPATPADLRGPSARWRRRKRRPAGRLVGAVLHVGTRGRWVWVPGPLFGLPKGRSTPFLAVWGRTGFGAAVDWVRRHRPEALFLAWPRRQEVEPFTVEELPHEELPHEELDAILDDDSGAGV